LNSEESTRLGKCEPLSGTEAREKQMLIYDQGFPKWKKKDFRQFVQALIEHGPDNLQAVVEAIKRQPIEEVVCYSQQFWLKCHELQNAEEILGKLNRADLLLNRRKALQETLGKKINESNAGEDSWIKYQPERWKGQRFSSEDDNQLLIQVFEIGLETPDVFAILQSKLIRSDEYSPFLRTRTKEELHTRFNLLMHMIEAETNENGAPSIIFPQQETNEFVLNGDDHSVLVQKNGMNSDQLITEGIIKGKPSSSQSSKSAKTVMAESIKDSPGMAVNHNSKKRKWIDVDEGNNDEDIRTKSSRQSEERFYEFE
jgi:hypothetical protein